MSMAIYAVEEGGRSLDRQLAHLDSIDLKASFISAAAAATLAGLVAAIATHPLSHPTAKLAAGFASLALLVSLVSSLRAWHPREVKAPPRIGGLRQAIDGD